MTDTTPTSTAELRQASDQGRREGLALAAVALGLVSFVNLLGAEKSILAIVLAMVALSGSSPPSVRRKAFAAIVLSALQILTIITVLLLFRAELGQLIHLLSKLG